MEYNICSINRERNYHRNREQELITQKPIKNRPKQGGMYFKKLESDLFF